MKKKIYYFASQAFALWSNFVPTDFLSGLRETTLREENKFGRKECGIKDCEWDL